MTESIWPKDILNEPQMNMSEPQKMVCFVLISIPAKARLVKR